MGALTSKNFPFELRGWEIEKIESLDPTDSFGSNLKYLINNKQIIQTEPTYNYQFFFHFFISNKTRHFFDITYNKTDNIIKLKNLGTILKSLIKTIYFYELCFNKIKILNFFTIIFENVNIDILCLLSIFKNKYYFIKLKKHEPKILINNLEHSFLLNKIKLKNSNVCLLISNNPRLEGYWLNFNLKNRKIKGNFKIFSISSFLNLTFNTTILGDTSSILKSIASGNHFICQNLKLTKNPIFILNTEFFKRNDSNFLYNNLLLYFQYLKNYCKINTINASIFETGINSINKFETITKTKDMLLESGSIYLLNILNLKNNYLNKVISTYLFFSIYKQIKLPFIKPIFLYQNYHNNFLKNKINHNNKFSNIKNFNKYQKHFYLPTKTIFETQEFFLNTEGFIKKTVELFSTKKLTSSWKLIRNIFNKLEKHLTFFNQTFIINFKIKNRFNFISIIFLLFLAVKKLNNCNYKINNNNSFFINQYSLFKKK
jgi:hypothetical protein